ncbi:MAG: hypothetical protein ACK40G_14770 [Cytophagaceae bacterium]
MLNKTNTIEFHDFDFEEFIKELEESFEIQFDDNDFKEVFNVGQFVEVICNKVNATVTNSCSSQIVYYKLRKVILEKLNKSIHPKTNLYEIFPKDNKEEFWCMMSENLGLKLPGLLPPRWFTVFITSPLFFMIFGSFLLLFFQFIIGAFIFVTSLILLKVSMMVSDRYFNDYPVDKIENLVTQVLIRNYKKINQGRFDKREVENIIKEMLLDYSGMDKNKFNNDIRLVG